MTHQSAPHAQQDTDASPRPGTMPDDDVIIEFVPSEQVPDEHRKDNKIFEPGTKAVTMRGTSPGSPTLYFTEGEWEAFIAGVKDGEFDDLLTEEPTPAD